MDFPALITFLSELALNNKSPGSMSTARHTNNCAASGSRSSARSSMASPGSIPAWASCRRRMRCSASIATSASPRTNGPTRPRSARRSARKAAIVGCRPTTSRSTKGAPCLLAAASICRTHDPGPDPAAYRRAPGAAVRSAGRSGLCGHLWAINGERLKRPPQGYDETTPGIEFIKLKSFTVGSEPLGWLARGDNLADEIVAAFRAMFPLIGWLRAALTGSSDLGYLSPQEIDRLAGLGPQQRQ